MLDFKAVTFRAAQTVAKAVSLGLNLLIAQLWRAYETATFTVPLNPALRIAFVSYCSLVSTIDSPYDLLSVSFRYSRVGEEIFI